MTARADMIERCKVGCFLEMRDAAAVNDRHAQVVDPLIADEVVRVPDRIEDFAYRDGRRRVLADDLKPSCNSAGTGSSIQKR